MKNAVRLKTMSLFLFCTFIIFSTGCDTSMIPAEKANPERVEVVVSDGITNNDLETGGDEILPNATVFDMDQRIQMSLARLMLAKKINGIQVNFLAREYDGTWIPLGPAVETDDKGVARMDGVRKYLPETILNKAPIDIQLKCEIVFENNTIVSDDKGLIRILDENTDNNPGLVMADHDNTLHGTGGGNTIQDYLDFLNFTKEEWPYVDKYVKGAVAELLNDGKDMIVVTGMFHELRSKCREQMNLHFEETGRRQIPIIVKNDLLYEHSNEYKAAAIGILKSLYGTDNTLAMVGDTVRQDGYGAIANDVFYIPFQIHYQMNRKMLDTEGFGEIDLLTIAWNWDQVMKLLEPKIPSDNFFLKTDAFLNIAHRGGGILMPENTLSSYQNSIDVGADSIEGDVHATKDGVIVVSHDDTVNRCTDGKGKIKKFTLAEIRELDAGYKFTEDDGETYPYRGKGLKIPTLREVFELLNQPENMETAMILEIKSHEEETVDSVVSLIYEFNMENRLLMGAFNQQCLNRIKEKGEAQGLTLTRCFSTEGVIIC